jgi:predicted nucleic acid-binding protein
LAAVIFDEPEHDDVLKLLAGAALHAPFLLQPELANVAVKKSRRDPANERLYAAALAKFDTLDIQFHSTGSKEIAGLALLHGLSAYDASYLWLARTLNVTLVTLDKRLQAVI